VVVEVAVTWYAGGESCSFLRLVPGDSIVVPRRVPFESATMDREVPHGDERVLVVAVTHELQPQGLTSVKVYCLSRHGIVYVRRSTQVIRYEGELGDVPPR
jgi:hypothetical protein